MAESGRKTARAPRLGANRADGFDSRATRSPRRKHLLPLPLLVAIAAEALLPLVGGDLLPLALLSASHPSPFRPRLVGAPDHPLQLVRRLEDRDQLRRYHHLGAASRIARLPRFPLAHL